MFYICNCIIVILYIPRHVVRVNKSYLILSYLIGPPVTQQRRYEWQRSLATKSEYMVDSVITHANKTASTVYWKCLLCSSL